MSKYVLDASAILALLQQEPGADFVLDALSSSIVSAVNIAEVVTRLIAIGMPRPRTQDVIANLGLEVIPFDEEQAYVVGDFYSMGRPLGLSMGDKACLALAQIADRTALTADRVWEKLDIPIKIEILSRSA